MSADADRYHCPQCSEIHERVCARIAADRIAQLTAELAEAWRVAEIWRNDERAAHERTKADLADARASLAKVRHDCDEMIRVHDEVEAERDAALARLASVEAEAAAKHAALVVVRDWVLHDVDQATALEVTKKELNRVIDGAAGLALAARVPLLEAVVTAARHVAFAGYHSSYGDWDVLRQQLAALDEKGGG